MTNKVVQFKKFWNYSLVFLTIVFHKNAQNIIPFSEKFTPGRTPSWKIIPLVRPFEAHFSGTTGAQAVHPVYRTSHRTEVQGAAPDGCHPFYPRLKRSSVAESVAESIEVCPSVTCVASVSTRVRRESWDWSKKRTRLEILATQAEASPSAVPACEVMHLCWILGHKIVGKVKFWDSRTHVPTEGKYTPHFWFR